jgi:hypothetical protein
MRRGFLIDESGQLWPAPRPDRGAVGALGRFYIGPAPNGIEMMLFGECIAARTLTKVLHILGLMRPKRIALIQVEEAGERITIFPGVWEFADYAGASAPACLDEPALEPSGNAPPLLSLL